MVLLLELLRRWVSCLCCKLLPPPHLIAELAVDSSRFGFECCELLFLQRRRCVLNDTVGNRIYVLCTRVLGFVCSLAFALLLRVTRGRLQVAITTS